MSALKITCVAALAATAVAYTSRALTESSAPLDLSFEGIGVPIGPDQHNVIASSYATLDGKGYHIGWNKIIRTGETVRLQGVEDYSKWPYGGVVTQSGTPVYTFNETTGAPTDIWDISAHPDFSSYLTPEGTDSIFMITHFESPRPAVMYSVELSQDELCGLHPERLNFVDWSSFGGLWVPCAGSVTSWGTHLGSEEYEPDARALAEATTVADISEDITTYMRYFDLYPADLTDVSVVTDTFKPYRYGFTTEISIDKDGKTTPNKHYAMGRFAHELCIVMPDDKTAYCTDDGSNIMGVSAFVADTAGDFSSGTLYASKYHQTSAAPAAFNVEWISLGHATADDVKDHIDTITFSDMFETEEPAADGQSCPSADFTLVNCGDYGAQCLKLVDGMDMLASRLETRRYAAYMGATTEFTKWEGITFDPAAAQIHTSISYQYRGMEDYANEGEPSTDYDIPTANDLRIPANVCGCVYTMDVDTSGDWYKATNFYAARCGVPNMDPNAENTCTTGDISNPDNTILAENRLILAEDTDHHVNNYMWALSYDAKDPVRILTAPYLAEVTGSYWHRNLGPNMCSYLTTSIQHPYDGDDELILQAESTGKAGWSGFIGPFKA